LVCKLPKRGGVRVLACLLVFVALGLRGQQATLLGDSHVSSARTLVNAGNLSNLDVGGGSTALVQFDLGTLAASTTATQIARATLRVYCNRADTPGAVSVQAVQGTWSEGGITYATLPGLGPVVQTAQVNSVGQFVTFDVTSTVQQWVSTPSANNGLALTASSAVVQFDSKENDQTAHAPQLEIALASGSGTGGAAGATGATGATGPVGATGAVGMTGLAGATGAAGIAGAKGFTGATGLPGATGSGLPGATGATGAPGLVYEGTYSPGANYAIHDVVIFAGSSYVSLTASNLGNTPSLNPGVWGPLTAQGPVGQTGATGATGMAGPQGLLGSTGPLGEQGAQGVPGATGAVGATGATGANGAVGMNFRGAWAQTVNYAVNDAVTYNGSTYLALAAGRNLEPDNSPQAWVVIAQAGGAGPTGAAGGAATVAIGTVTTLAAGASATVTNAGTAQAAVLNFGIPQGIAGAAGSTGGGGTVSSSAFAATYHTVSFATDYYSVNTPNADLNENADILAWVPMGCTATRLEVYSQQSGNLKVTLRTGTPGSMADTALVCSPPTASSCSVTGSVTIPAGNFVDFRFDSPSGTPAGVWTWLQCN